MCRRIWLLNLAPFLEFLHGIAPRWSPLHRRLHTQKAVEWLYIYIYIYIRRPQPAAGEARQRTPSNRKTTGSLVSARGGCSCELAAALGILLRQFRKRRSAFRPGSEGSFSELAAALGILLRPFSSAKPSVLHCHAAVKAWRRVHFSELAAALWHSS